MTPVASILEPFDGADASRNGTPENSVISAPSKAAREMRAKTRGKLGDLRRRIAFATAGIGALAGAAYAQPAFAADDAPAVVAAADPKKPTLSAAEIAALDPEKIDYVEYAPLFAMLRDRGIPVYINPREGERPVAPIRTRDDLRSLVDGARDMPGESVDDVLGTKGARIDATNLGQFLDGITDYRKFPKIVDWRTVSRDGGKTFLPIFEKGSVTPRPGMEADAQKVLKDIDTQRAAVVEPVLAGKVDAKTLERWAGQINAVVGKIAPDVRGRETFRRAVLNGYLGIDYMARQFQARGVDSLLGKSVDDPESGRKVYVPSGRSRVILSTAVELARLMGATNPGTEYISRVRIGSEDVSLKMGDIGRGDGFETVKALTGTLDEFWSEVRSVAAGEGAVALATERVAKNPDVQALMKSETPDTMRKWAPLVDQGLLRTANRNAAIAEIASKATGADQTRLTMAGTNALNVSIADAAAASLYWQRTEKLMEQRGIDLNNEFRNERNPLGEIGGNDGDGVRGMLRGKKKPGT